MSAGVVTLVREYPLREKVMDALDELRVGDGQPFVVARPEMVSTPEKSTLAPFARDQETSRLAALAVTPRAGTKRATVLALIRDSGHTGRTRDELCVDTGWPPNVVTPRVWELVNGGWVYEAGRTRKTRAGEQASVLELTTKGRGHFGLEAP